MSRRKPEMKDAIIIVAYAVWFTLSVAGGTIIAVTVARAMGVAV